jgi:FtsP/CotA-like multicopper oxidase with cupredoxin domain
VKFEKFSKVDPTLPAVPAGAVKKFTVDVFQHVTQVDPTLAPTEAWSYAVSGKAYRGTAASPPIVVNQGDKVQITFVNGSTKKMAVNKAHSIDFHSAEVAPNKNYIDIAPGKRITINFVASTRACSCTTAPPSRCSCTRAPG